MLHNIMHTRIYAHHMHTHTYSTCKRDITPTMTAVCLRTIALLLQLPSTVAAI